MRHAFLAVMLAAAATPAFAGDFVVDGQHVTYTAARNAQGDVLLSGYAGVDPFTFRVHGSHVDGTMGASDVSFRLSPATVARLAVEVPGETQQADAIPATLASN